MKKQKKIDIGIDVDAPKKECGDPHCPFHGELRVRGQTIEGMVVSDKGHQTVVVEKEHAKYNKKYERYERRLSRYSAHSPKCLEAAVNDSVSIMECRPISKTKSFVVVRVKK